VSAEARRVEGEGAAMLEEVPGFEVVGVEAMGAAVWGVEGDGEASADGGKGDDVPGFFADDVEGHEVDFGFAVGLAAASEGATGVDLVEAVGSPLVGRFDLEAPAVEAVVDDEVVGEGVAEGFGEAEAAGGGGEEEGHFGGVAAEFG
jgi:hypothetical protein